MKDNRSMSSVQALDSYFDALLSEDDIPQEKETDVMLRSVASANTNASIPTLETKLVTNKLKSIGAILTQAERDFFHVEKLLSQLKFNDDMEDDVECFSAMKIEVETDTISSVDACTTVLADIQTDTVVAPLNSIESKEIKNESLGKVVNLPESQPNVEKHTCIKDELGTQRNLEVQSNVGITLPWENIASEHAFQVLFFESVGVTYAVPLAELGGIHCIEECHHLIGRPDWYLGLQTERGQQFDIVDTAQWVMPEKMTDNNHRDDYSYIVLLGDSKWALACNTLQGTELVKSEHVRWREKAGKRPWLAGLVKEKMCALIHVEALIAMLNQGIDVNALA